MSEKDPSRRRIRKKFVRYPSLNLVMKEMHYRRASKLHDKSGVLQPGATNGANHDQPLNGRGNHFGYDSSAEATISD